MGENSCGGKLSSEALMEIISIQTEVAKLGPDLGAIMHLVTEKVQDLTGSDGAIVELAEGEDMVYRAATGIAAAQLGLRLRRTSSLSGMCVRTGEVLNCKDSETDKRVDREACRRVGLRSMVVAPLLHGQNVVGALKIVSAIPKHFTDEHLCTLKLMTELIGASMYHSTHNQVEALHHRATHDALTGLGNRALFYDRLRQHLALVRRRASQLGLLFLDMDDLKTINDTYGHRAGDAAIQEAARRARDAARESDVVARLGGDEFAILLPDVQDKECLDETAERISEQICGPFQFEGNEFDLGASVGAALFPDDAEDLEGLVEKADRHMYLVKREKKGEEPR